MQKEQTKLEGKTHPNTEVNDKKKTCN